MRNFETGRNTPISYQYQLCKMSVEDSVALIYFSNASIKLQLKDSEWTC